MESRILQRRGAQKYAREYGKQGDYWQAAPRFAVRNVT
jgi:hypothetical protein